VKRKINKVGTGTLTVSLPSEWVIENKLKAGDELNVDTEKGRIIFESLQKEDSPKKITFKIETPSMHRVRKYLYSGYVMGYDTIELHYNDPSVFKDINKHVDNLIGFEIISQQKNSCVIRNVASPRKESFNDLVNKLFQFGINLSEEVLEAFKNKDRDALSKLEDNDIVHNKISVACQRLLLQLKEKNSSYIGPMYFIISEIEGIADDFKYICNCYKETIPHLDQNAEHFFKKIIEMYKLTYHQFLLFDFSQKIGEMHRELNYIGIELLKNCSNDHKVLISFLLDSSFKMYDLRRELFYLNMEKDSYDPKQIKSSDKSI